ncbi:MAG: hypothetical protein MJ252_16690 [archaeon]|nr:hypothetical protein [archaeon]
MISIKTDNQKSEKNKSLYPKFPSWHQRENGKFKLSLKNEKDKGETEKEENNFNEENKELNKEKTLEFNDDFKEGMFVMTEWGPGKITSVNRSDKSCNVKIEDSTVPFPYDTLKASLNIYLCIVEKSKQYWGIINVQFTDTVKGIRIKIGRILNVHYSQVVILKSGKQLKSNDRTILDLELFEKDELLVVIKDEAEKRNIRFKSEKTANMMSGFNSICFESNEDIYLTGMDLYKNSQKNIYYEIKIMDAKKSIIYNEKNIQVDKYEKEADNLKKIRDNMSKKYEFERPILIKKKTVYEIQQNISYGEEGETFFLKEQIIGYSIDENKEWDKAELTFTAATGKASVYNKDNNMTSVNQGLISSLYYVFKI